MIEFFTAQSAADFQTAASMFREYAEAIQIDLCFQQFDEELKHLHVMYNKPGGAIVLAKRGDECIGCVGLRSIDTFTAELKRMYVKPAYQNLGLGAQLLNSITQLAMQLGYREIKLDTLRRMHPAIALYKKYGFVETAPYYNNPHAEAVYFKKKL